MQREASSQHSNPPLDPSLHDGGHDRMNLAIHNGTLHRMNVSLREFSLPPEDLSWHVADVDAKQENVQDVGTSLQKSRKSSRREESRKKKHKKKRRENKSKTQCCQLAQEPDNCKRRQRKHKQRVIPESLTGREVSWRRSYLESADDLPFHEDLIKSSEKLRRHSHRHNSNNKAPVREVRLDVVEEGQQTKGQIILDPDGFPIEDDDDSVHSLDIRDFATHASAHRFDDSITPTEMSHVGSHFQDSLTSIEKTLADSHLQQHESLNSNEKLCMPVSLQDSCTSTETVMTPSSSNPAEGAQWNAPPHNCLPKHIREEMVAVNTAAAFEAFLRRQHDVTSKMCDSDASSHSWSLKEDDKGSSSSVDLDDPFRYSRFGGSELALLPCGGDDDDDDVKTFQEEEELGSPSFGRVRRNESFVKRVSSKELFTSSSERTLQSSYILDSHSTAQTDRSDFTFSSLRTRDLPGKLGAKALFRTQRPPNLDELQSTRSLDAVTAHERPIERQLASLSLSQRSCVNALKAKWEKENGVKYLFPDDWYLRFARCSPGYPFNFQSAWKVMNRFDWHYCELSILKMEATVKTKTAFPLPGLKTKGGRDVFYIRPSRYCPSKAPADNMIDLVVYVMNCMLEKEHGSIHGIGLIANMTGWKMENFGVSYWHKFLVTLQGHRVPTRISAFLIVDPPDHWFGSIWAIMKPMLSDDFREKVVVVRSDELGNYLMDGYRRHIPNEMQGGTLSTSALVKSFIAERKAIERAGCFVEN